MVLQKSHACARVCKSRSAPGLHNCVSRRRGAFAAFARRRRRRRGGGGAASAGRAVVPARRPLLRRGRRRLTQLARLQGAAPLRRRRRCRCGRRRRRRLLGVHEELARVEELLLVALLVLEHRLRRVLRGDPAVLSPGDLRAQELRRAEIGDLTAMSARWGFPAKGVSADAAAGGGRRPASSGSFAAWSAGGVLEAASSAIASPVSSADTSEVVCLFPAVVSKFAGVARSSRCPCSWRRLLRASSRSRRS